VSPNPRHEVKGCETCPLSAYSVIDQDSGTEPICQHPAAIPTGRLLAKRHYPIPEVAPAWCPLRTAPLLLWMSALKEKKP
jgi:hypothetical protein